MKRNLYIIFICFFWLIIPRQVYSQIEQNICHIVNGKLMFDLRFDYDQDEIMQLEDLYGLDSSLYHLATQLEPTFSYNGEVWYTKKKKGKKFLLWKDIDQKDVSIDINLPLISNLFNFSSPPPAPPKQTNWGYNQLRNEKAVTIKSDSVTFNLFGFTEANQVILSGSFNNWSTHQIKMNKTNLGWSITIPLKPGYYQYKYIIDGEWRADPSNLLSTDDLQGGVNSELYIPNHTFELLTENNYKQVYLAGSFNDWNPSNIKMKKEEKRWYLEAWLKEGTHSYKFIADNAWMYDVSNPNKLPDGHGDYNSVFAIGDTVMFQLDNYSNAQSVILAGSFNNWNTQELHMKRKGDSWVLPYVLGAGNHEYKFIVDGQWITDPKNALTKTSSGITNSLLILHPNHTFVLNGNSNAKKVIVTGTFNDWDKEGFLMKKVNNQWVFQLHLPQGKTLYKFIVDGNWIIDPENGDWEENAEGTGNSILWVTE